MTPLLPQIASRSGLRFALHMAFDDAKFPLRTEVKLNWQAADGTTLETLTRIPLAGDQPLSYGLLPQKLARTMQADHVATLVLAHWPASLPAWYDDLRRAAQFSPTLGRFSLLTDFFHASDSPFETMRTHADDYQSAFLLQDTLAGLSDPIARHSEHARARGRLETVRWLEGVRRSIASESAGEAGESGQERLAAIEERIEAGGPSPAEELAALELEAGANLARDVLAASATGARGAGWIVFNPCSFARRAPLELPGVRQAPPAGGPVKRTQWSNGTAYVVVDVPALGFAWVPQSASAAPAAESIKAWIAEGRTLRNEYFQVEIDERSGGIRGASDFEDNENRLGQQLIFHRPSEDETAARRAAEFRSSRMVAGSVRVTTSGPVLGEIVSEGRILDAVSDSVLARFRQRFRLWIGRRILEVRVELSELAEAVVEEMARAAAAGRPWEAYFASRFAWRSDVRPGVRRLVGLGVEPTTLRRPESPWLLGLVERGRHTQILGGGLPYYQRQGERMLDLLLIAGREQARSFEFAVGLDLPAPACAALSMIQPLAVVPVEAGPPASGPQGWFFHLDSRSVIVTSLGPVPARGAGASRAANIEEQAGSVPYRDGTNFSDPSSGYSTSPPPSSGGIRVRLCETAGVAARVRLRCPAAPRAARHTDFRGELITDLTVEGDAVLIDLAGHEILQAEIDFA